MKTLATTLGFIAAATLLVVFAGPSQQAAASAQSQIAAPAQPAAASMQAPEQDEAQPMGGTCLLCGRGSTGACKGARQCRGSRKACRAKGCKITGTSSCSTAANVKIC